MKTFIAFSVGMILLVAMTVSADAAMKIIHMGDGHTVEVGRLVEEVSQSDVIFVGDTHDDTRLHGNQLEIIRALYHKNPQMAIGLEMFTADSQPYLDEWTKGTVEEKDFLPVYAKNWSYDWTLYRDIFIFARDNHIPMIALNVPKAVISKVVRQGAKSLTESERKELPPGATWTLNPRQAAYLRLIRERVFGNAPPRFPATNFEEAQALRNDTMAYNIARFREKSPKSKVVVIAGTWHSIKNGAPDSLKKYGTSTFKIILPDLVEFAWLNPTAEDMDYLIFRGK